MDALKPSEAIFVFVNNAIPPASNFLSQVYAENKDAETYMLYMDVCKENTFG